MTCARVLHVAGPGVRTQRDRSLWHWVNVVFNRVDRSRVRDVGPDRAAAEWALRLGGRVRFHGNDQWSADYNRLPSRPPGTLQLAAINVEGLSITDNGLEHLDGLAALETLSLARCRYVTDLGLPHLSLVSGSLQELDISYCPRITDVGLRHLHTLRLLRRLDVSGLRLTELPALKAAIPHCHITTAND